jgi:hypothetical protein
MQASATLGAKKKNPPKLVATLGFPPKLVATSGFDFFFSST